MKLQKIKVVFSILILFCLSVFSGCTADVKLELKKDGNVQVSFKGGAGQAFTKMIQAATGTGGPGADLEIYDTNEIAMELAKSGFSNVQVNSNKADITVSMTENTGKSFLFTSGILKKTKEELSTELTPKSLSAFYSTADEQIVMILDLLLAPVFNDETMTQEEYLEILASFYGEGIAKELKESTIKITLVNVNGKKVNQTIPLAKLLCLDETISLHSSNL